VGCQPRDRADPREKEVVRALDGKNSNYEAAIKKARELYSGKELDIILNKLEEERRMDEEYNKKFQERYEKIHPERKLSIQEGWKVTVEGNYCYIQGRVKNVSDTAITYFEVRADYLDADENVLDSNYTNDGLHLNPGDMREFEIMHKYSEDYKKYRISIGKVR